MAKNARPELIQGKKYVITQTDDTDKHPEKMGVKYPQTVVYDEGYFWVKDKNGFSSWWPGWFDYHRADAPTVEIYPYKGGFKFRVRAANGKLTNHTYNSVGAAKKGINALKNALETGVIKVIKK